MTSSANIECWFDFASTYTYLSVMRIEALTAAHNIPLIWKPFLLGPIFQQQGWNNSPFNVYPVKGHYMWRDLERRTAKYGIPFNKPSAFPRNGLLAARISLLAEQEAWCGAFIKRVFTANFVEDREIGDAAVIADILQELGLDAAEIIGRAQQPANKNRLRTQTEQAQALGIFGAPTFVIGRELFWGDDRLEDALAFWLDKLDKDKQP